MTAKLTEAQWAETRKSANRNRRGDGTYNVTAMATELGIHRFAVQKRLRQLNGGIRNVEHPFASGPLPPAWTQGPSIEIVSRRDNSFCFGAFGDLHAGSKYSRFDVREDLVRKAEESKAQAIFDTGNWIDGEARFNKYDVETTGMDLQLQLLARKHPKTKLPIYAVTGDDHEGWYAQREGVDIGRYCENIMRGAGHNWNDLGYMESHVRLVNVNSGRSAIMAIIHPGGGSAYAISYRPQKIIESLEGGEKPAVMLIGHYHKLAVFHIRNIWVVQTGCQQDQTPFLRKKSIEVHVGGVILTLGQDPKTGSIISCLPDMRRYFTQGMNFRWSRHGAVAKPERIL